MTVNAIGETQICNMALSRMGSTQSITSLQDGSNEANQCLIWYPQDRDALLSDYPWPWADAYAVLAQIGGPEINGQRANAQWLRSYRYPTDCVTLRRLVFTPSALSATGIPQTTGLFNVSQWCNEPWRRADGNPYPISFSLSMDAGGRLIVTDALNVTAVYTSNVVNPAQFDPTFADALAWRLAADLAMGLGFSDAKRQYAEQKYEKVIRRASADAFNEQQSDMPLIRYQSETVRARWGG